MDNPCSCPAGPYVQQPVGPELAEVCGGSQFMLFLGVLSEFFASQCDLLDPCRQPKSIEEPYLEYDFIVIGAGSAGCVVASRLSANPAHQVLLIEAGGSEPTDLQVPAVSLAFIGSRVEWGYRTEPSEKAYKAAPGRSTRFTVGKVLGGSSALNGMFYLRGNPDDFDGWERLGNAGWSYAEVLEYFKKAERHTDPVGRDREYHGFEGPLTVSTTTERSPLAVAILQAAQTIGLQETDLNAANCTGAMLADSTVESGVRMSTARAYLRPHLARPNLHILLNTRVTRVLLDEGTNRASRVVAIRDGGSLLQIAARKEVILCAGAVGSPRLLLNSGIGPLSELQPWQIPQLVNLPAVGRNLQNHLAVGVQFKATAHPAARLDWASVTKYLLTRKGPLASSGTFVHLKFASKYAANPTVAPDLQATLQDSFVATSCTKTGEVQAASDTNSLVLSAFVVNVQPQSRGHIGLRSADPLADPRIFSNDLDVAADADVLVDGVLQVLKVFQSSALDGYNLTFMRTGSGAGLLKPCGLLDWKTAAYWRCMIYQDTNHYGHPTGTCRMGMLAEGNSVVDNELRVHYVPGLRIADASVMPQIVAANTNAATIMIGEMAADMIENSY